MENDNPGPPEVSEPAAQVDHEQLDALLKYLRSRQNLPAGILAGFVGAVIGAAVWATITVVTHYQIGWVAVGVGFLVGIFVRKAGKGVDPVFGVVGAALALLGCVAGNLLAVCEFLAEQEKVAFLDVVTSLNPQFAWVLLSATFQPMDALFYGIALYEGYKLSIHRITGEQLSQFLQSQAPAGGEKSSSSPSTTAGTF